jgi:thiamine-monophosphate kinase
MAWPRRRARARASMREVGEFRWLAMLLPRMRTARGVMVGPGDDCAVLSTGARRVLLTTDAVVEDVHFRRAWMTPAQIGRKAYLVNASDIAAMGGRPRFCVVSVAVPGDFPARDLLALQAGLSAAARDTGAVVVGGNVARARQLVVSVTVLGDAPYPPLCRGGARPGDGLYVTGTLGDAALGRAQLERNARARSRAVRRFREPQPRLAVGLALARAGLASAAIDISDGLLQDLRHVCTASGVGAEVQLAAMPCAPAVRRAGLGLALGGGEDYELLFTVPPRHQAPLPRLARALGCPLSRIGQVRPKRYGIRVLDAEGRPVAIERGGYDHFRAFRAAAAR